MHRLNPQLPNSREEIVGDGYTICFHDQFRRVGLLQLRLEVSLTLLFKGIFIWTAT